MSKKKNGNANGLGEQLVGDGTAEQAKQLIRAAVAAHMPVILVGLPGMGKTAMINDMAREDGYDSVIQVIGSQMEPTDVSGIPYPSEHHDFTQYLMPVWQYEACDSKPHVLFLDEFSNTSRATQAGLLKLIGERLFANGDYVPDNVAIIGAMNPETCAVDYNPLGLPMSNRIMFIAFHPSDEEIFEGMSGGWFPNWNELPEDERRWRERVVSFLKSYRYLIHKMPEDFEGDEDTQAAAYLNPYSESDASEREVLNTAWASPRSWDNACRVLGNLGYSKSVLTPSQERVLAGCVGREAQVKLSDWVHQNAKIDPYDAICNPTNYVWDSTAHENYDELQEMAFAVANVIGKCNGENGAPEPEQAMTFLESMPVLGGAPLFAAHIGKGGIATKALKDIRPEDIPAQEWAKRSIHLLMAYHECGAMAGSEKNGVSKKEPVSAL